jgi:hypothetical protein
MIDESKEIIPAIAESEHQEHEFLEVAERRIHALSDDISTPPPTTVKMNAANLFSKTELWQLAKILNKNSPEIQ